MQGPVEVLSWEPSTILLPHPTREATAPPCIIELSDLLSSAECSRFFSADHATVGRYEETCNKVWADSAKGLTGVQFKSIYEKRWNGSALHLADADKDFRWVLMRAFLSSGLAYCMFTLLNWNPFVHT